LSLLLPPRFASTVTVVELRLTNSDEDVDVDDLPHLSELPW
jgi:hypothetical protein